MTEFCEKCGARLKGSDIFCPNCGKRVVFSGGTDKSYGQLIKEIVYIRENGRYRLSKAKLLGVLMFLFIFFNIIFSISRSSMRHFISFMIMIIMIFIAGLFWYGVCRIGGYLIRTYVIK